MCLREANVIDAVFNTVKGALTLIHTSPRTNQFDESGVVNSELTVSQVSQEPAQTSRDWYGYTGYVSYTATIPDSKPRNVVLRRMTRTRRIIKTIKGTSKRVTFGSVSVQEEGSTNEMFKAVEDKMPEASSTEVIHHVLKSAGDTVISRR